MRRIAVALAVLLVASLLWLAGSRDAHRPLPPAPPIATHEQPAAPIELVPAESLAPSAQHAMRMEEPAAPVVPASDSERTPATQPWTSTSPASLDAPPTLAGVVIEPGGAPVVGADVKLEFDAPFRSLHGSLARALTDDAGRFELRTPYTGPFRLLATVREKRQVTGQCTLDAVEPGQRDLVIVLSSTTVRGVVVDDAGAPVTDYRVLWRPLLDGAPSRESPMNLRVRSETGEFTAELSPGPWLGEFSARSGFVLRELELDVPALQAPTIVLARKAVLRGAVIDPAGRSVAQAAVAAGSNRTATEKDGTFRIEVDPGLASVWADDGDFGSSELLELELAPGEERDGIVLRLLELAHLTGELLDPSGRPVAGREIHAAARHQDGMWSDDDRSGGRAVTDDSGRFAFSLRPGEIEVMFRLMPGEIEALGQGTAGLIRSITLAPGEHAHLRIELDGQPVRVHGRIELAGRAPERARIELAYMGSWPHGTYAEGRYELSVPLPGVYTLLVSADGMNVQHRLDVPAAPELRHDVTIAVGHVAGRVQDDSGRPVAGITVHAMSAGESDVLRSSGHARTDDGGAYSIALLAGRYRVTPRTDSEVDRAFVEPEPALVDVTADGTLTGVDFVLRRTGAITGTVLTTSGAVPVRSSVRATPHGGDWPSDARTDEHGRFLLPLEPGTYWLTAEGGDDGAVYELPAPLRVELARGATRQVELRLTPSTMVAVHAIDVADPRELRLEALDARGRSHPAAMDDAGVHHLVLPAPASYVLRGSRSGAFFERPLVLEAWVPRTDIELRLDR